MQQTTTHQHHGYGIRVDAVGAREEQLHYHISALGATAIAPNRPGHRHQLPNGIWTKPQTEQWSSAGVRRL